MSEQQRPETGPMAFGDDWPGIFVRGDDAHRLAQGLREALAVLPDGAEALAGKIALHDAIWLLGYCAVQRHDPGDCQRLAPWEDCQPVTAPPAQPAPKPEGVDVIADLCRWVEPSKRPLLMARRALGVERYGQPLMSEDGRDTRRDLREELLDAAAYAWSMHLQTGDGDDARWGGLMRGLLEMVDIVDDEGEW